jgi:Icc protein
VIVVRDIARELVSELRYLNASSNGKPEVVRLPIAQGTLASEAGARDVRIADELDAVIVCSDLQGVVPNPRTRLSEPLGIALAEHLEELALAGTIPPAARTGVILAGDLYSDPAAKKRGGFGCVAKVWEAFADRFAWVTGVAGNHDDMTQISPLLNLHVLDGSIVELDGLRFGGVGGIIGNKEKKMRRPSEEFLALVDRVIDQHVDILVLHEGPNGDPDNDDQRGNPDIRATVEAGEVGVTVCGHCHWDVPLASHASGQVLNVDARCVVLRVSR